MNISNSIPRIITDNITSGMMDAVAKMAGTDTLVAANGTETPN